MRVSAVLLIAAAALAAQAQAPRPAAPMQDSMRPAATVPSAAASAEQQSTVPPTLANSPPQPPDVRFQNGLLSIHAENSTLADVLNDVRSKTGTQIQVPPGASTERVVVQQGPAPLRDALVALLQGSGFDYIILGSAQNPETVERVLLTPHVANSAAAMQPAYNSQRNEYQYQPEIDQNSEAPGMPLPQPEPVQPNVGQSPAGQSSGGIKTPEQLLRELQQLRAGQQGQQGQTQGQTTNGQPAPPQMPPRRIPMNPPN